MSKNNKENSNLAVATTSDSVTDSLGALKAELKQLKTITETQYKTGSDGKVTGFPNAIQNETSVENLIKMHSSASGRASAYNASQKRLSDVAGGPVLAPPFKDNGASLESIEQDIALRIQVLNVSDRKKQLEDLIKEAEGFLTETDKFKLFQQKLKKALNNSPYSGEETVEEA